MARRKDFDEDERDFLDQLQTVGDGEKDYSVLVAEAETIRANAEIAKHKVAVWDETEQLLQRANELTAWKRSSRT